VYLSVKEMVEQVSNGADQVSQASQDLSQGATEQASSLEEITSSTNQINSQSKQNAENATEAHAWRGRLPKTPGTETSRCGSYRISWSG
jgi:methyl-accepting chemotaxis protein